MPGQLLDIQVTIRKQIFYIVLIVLLYSFPKQVKMWSISKNKSLKLLKIEVVRQVRFDDLRKYKINFLKVREIGMFHRNVETKLEKYPKIILVFNYTKSNENEAIRKVQNIRICFMWLVT